MTTLTISDSGISNYREPYFGKKRNLFSIMNNARLVQCTFVVSCLYERRLGQETLVHELKK